MSDDQQRGLFGDQKPEPSHGTTPWGSPVTEDWTPGHHARGGHPDTSYEAAHAIAGTISESMANALEALERHPRSTAAEIEDAEGITDGAIRKRLNDLRIRSRAHKGPKRKCRITGRNAYTWLPGRGPAVQ